MTSSLFEPEVITSPAATPSTVLPYSDTSTSTEYQGARLSEPWSPSSSEVRAHDHHRDEALIASALLFGAVRSLQKTNTTKEISQEAVNGRVYPLQSGNNWRELQLGGGKPISWWLQNAATLRKYVIADTATQFSLLMPPILQPAVSYGVRKGLQTLASGGFHRTELQQLANSTELVSRRWVAAYSRQLGAGLGNTSADGLLVSMAQLQHVSTADRIGWQIVNNAAGLPHGQALSVVQVAQNRLKTVLSTRRPMTPRDLGADVGKLLLSRRARNVYANENEVARNFGTQLLLMNAVARGYLPADSRKVWVTAVDERVCPVCAPMDSVAVQIDEPFQLRAHKGVLGHDQRLWVPPAHPKCRCRIVPERVIEHGVITRTARFSRNEQGRARLVSQLSDLVNEARPSWVDSDDIQKSFIEVLHPRSPVGRFIAAGAVGALAAREVAHVYATHQQTRYGYAMTSGIIPRRRFRTVKGISDAPLGTSISNKTHPEGTYLISMASLAPLRSRTSISPSENPAVLRQSMQRNGFTHPVHLRAYDDGAQLWDGNHRLNLAEELQLTAVPVKVVHVAGSHRPSVTLFSALNRIQQHRYRARIVSRYQAD